MGLSRVRPEPPVTARGFVRTPTGSTSRAPLSAATTYRSGFLHEHLAHASPDLLRELMEAFVGTLSESVDSVRQCVTVQPTFRLGRC